MTEPKRIVTPSELEARLPLTITGLSEELRKILSSRTYAFTYKPEDGDSEEREVFFDIKAVDMPSDLSDADASLIWTVLSAFECSDSLDIEVYRSDRDDYIADLLICSGGPAVRARYESSAKRLTVIGAWGDSRFEIEARSKDFEGTPLADQIELAAYRD